MVVATTDAVVTQLICAYLADEAPIMQLSSAQSAPTQHGCAPTVTDRLAWTIQHAITSVSATSFTTAAAFAANLTSSITPVRLFGLFMVLLVLVNYVFVLTLLLAILVLRERSAAGSTEGPETRRGWRRLLPSLPVEPDEPKAWHEHVHDTELVPLAGLQRDSTPDVRGDARPAVGREWDASAADGRAMPHEAETDTDAAIDAQPADNAELHPSDAVDDDDDEELLDGGVNGARLPQRKMWRSRCRGCASEHGKQLQVHSWLGGPYARAVHGSRWVILAFTALAVAFFAWRASLLTLPESRPTVWRASSNFHKYYDLVRRPLTCAFQVACFCDGSVTIVHCCACDNTAAAAAAGACIVAYLLCLRDQRPAYTDAPKKSCKVRLACVNVLYAFLVQEMGFVFGRALERIPVSLVWGVHPQDTGSLNSVYEYTDAVLDTRAEFSSREAQVWLQALCAELHEWAQAPNSPIVAGTLQCPMPLVARIARARDLELPVDPEVWPPTSCSIQLFRLV